MDLLNESKREELFAKRREQLEARAGKFNVVCFPTSIWEVTLYKAWTEIVSTLTGNMPRLKESLANFASACGAEEVILFEKSTFLLTCSYTNKDIKDDQRFEKISHIIKKFKLSCMTSQAKFQSMVIQTKNFTTYLDEFTKSTYIMVILNDKRVNIELLQLNACLCKKAFEDRINGSIE